MDFEFKKETRHPGDKKRGLNNSKSQVFDSSFESEFDQDPDPEMETGPLLQKRNSIQHPQPPPSDTSEPLGLKSKTSLRMLYEAKSNLIRKQLGGLKGVQSELQLSQRKLAQLLMVDPSTWTRWVKNEDSIPPHIWRSLEWYLALQDKVPGLTAQHFIGKSSDDIEERFLILQKELREQVSRNLEQQGLQVGSKVKIIFWVVSGFSLLNLILLVLNFR